MVRCSERRRQQNILQGTRKLGICILQMEPKHGSGKMWGWGRLLPPLQSDVSIGPTLLHRLALLHPNATLSLLFSFFLPFFPSPYL